MKISKDWRYVQKQNKHIKPNTFNHLSVTKMKSMWRHVAIPSRKPPAKPPATNMFCLRKSWTWKQNKMMKKKHYRRITCENPNFFFLRAKFLKATIQNFTHLMFWFVVVLEANWAVPGGTNDHWQAAHRPSHVWPERKPVWATIKPSGTAGERLLGNFAAIEL